MSKGYSLPISRLFFMSTFIEDGLRMYFQWSEQSSNMDISWILGMS